MRRGYVLLFASIVAGCSSLRGGGGTGETPRVAAAPESLGAAAPLEVLLPMKEGSVRFAVFGDSGTGDAKQREVARMMDRYHERFPFTFAVMVGDNIYEPDAPADFQRKFQQPYANLLARGVKFYATLGNHDNPNQRFYAAFNMGGERYYSFKPAAGVRFFAVDSTYIDPPQLDWLGKELAASGSEWKIVFMHHPLYSSGDRHGPSVEKREALEPVLLKNGVSVVLTGHEHFYERLKPQKGVYHFITGGAAKLRPGTNVSDITEKGFDDDRHFMLMEISGDELYFQTISRTGRTVDSGKIRNPLKPAPETARSTPK
jgi:hypothetical protein